MAETLFYDWAVQAWNMLQAQHAAERVHEYATGDDAFTEWGNSSNVDLPSDKQILEKLLDTDLGLLIKPMMMDTVVSGYRTGFTVGELTEVAQGVQVAEKGMWSMIALPEIVTALTNGAGYNLQADVINSTTAAVLSRLLNREVSEDEVNSYVMGVMTSYDATTNGIRCLIDQDIADQLLDAMADADVFIDPTPEELIVGEQMDTGEYEIPICAGAFSAMLSTAMEQFYQAFDEGDLPSGTGLGDCIGKLDMMLERLPAIPANALATVSVGGAVGGDGTRPYFEVNLAIAAAWTPYVLRRINPASWNGDGYNLSFRTTNGGTDYLLAIDALQQETSIDCAFYNVTCTKTGENTYEISTASSAAGITQVLIAGATRYSLHGFFAAGWAGNMFTSYMPAREGVIPKGIGDDTPQLGIGTRLLHNIDNWAETWYKTMLRLVGIDGTTEDEKYYVGIDGASLSGVKAGQSAADRAQEKSQEGVLDPAIDFPLDYDYSADRAQPGIIDWAKILNPNIVIPSIKNPAVAVTADPDPQPTPSPVIPELPTVTAQRLYTVHKCSQSELNALGAYLWSSDFISLIEKMFTQPIDAVIGLHTLYHAGLPLGGSETIKLGSIPATGCTGTLVTNQYCQVDCGSVAIPEYYGNVEDYQPYSAAQIFLPFIGFKEIDINDIMGGSVYVKYGIDILTGACVATIGVMRDHVSQALYAFEGNCAIQQPVTSADYSRLISGLITIGAGIATGGTGAAVLGAGTLLSGAHRITYPRSGQIGANTGAYLQKKPYILIRRPLAFNASNYQHYYGFPSKWTVTLGQCHGYTKVSDMHLDAIQCTDDERQEIERLLKLGVMM